MSEALRGRLKRMSRYYTSPGTPKKLCTATSSSHTLTNPATNSQDHSDTNTPLAPYSNVTPDTSSTETDHDFHLDVQSPVVINSTPTEMPDNSQASVLAKEISSSATCKSTKLCITPISSLEKDPTICAKSVDVLKHEKAEILNRVTRKEETLRKLNMVKTYREKNDLAGLELLISKWKRISQEAMQELWRNTEEPRPSMTQLVDHLQIDHDMIGYDPDEESFS